VSPRYNGVLEWIISDKKGHELSINNGTFKRFLRYKRLVLFLYLALPRDPDFRDWSSELLETGFQETWLWP